jgi:hypothetical protein
MVPYERIIQWASGPFAVFIGGLAAKWVSSSPFLGQVGLSKDGTAKAITAATVFIVSAGVTILAHQKWMTNLAKWWTVNTAPVEPVVQVASSGPVSPDQPDPEQWAATRQSIADAMPATDPTVVT